MFLSDQAVKEFKEIYKDKFGVELSDEEAMTKGEDFLRFMKLILSPMPKKNEDTGNTGGSK